VFAERTGTQWLPPSESFLMKHDEYIPYRAAIEKYQHHAEMLLEGLKSGDVSAASRFKWMHPRFRDKAMGDVRSAALELVDAQLVVAHEFGFENWADLERFVNKVGHEGPVSRFEAAVEAVVSGDLATLRTMLEDDPGLVRARSPRRHHATLLTLSRREWRRRRPAENASKRG
jgi:hypothetical protein